MRTPEDLTEEQLLGVQIQDSGEEMVDIRKYCPGILIDDDLITDGGKPYLRKTVADMLNEASGYLPKELTFLVCEAYRSLQRQRKIWKNFKTRFKRQYPDWNENRVSQEVGK